MPQAQGAKRPRGRPRKVPLPTTADVDVPRSEDEADEDITAARAAAEKKQKTPGRRAAQATNALPIPGAVAYAQHHKFIRNLLQKYKRSWMPLQLDFSLHSSGRKLLTQQCLRQVAQSTARIESLTSQKATDAQLFRVTLNLLRLTHVSQGRKVIQTIAAKGLLEPLLEVWCSVSFLA